MRSERREGGGEERGGKEEVRRERREGGGEERGGKEKVRREEGRRR